MGRTELFDRLAPCYDRVNRVLSLGLDPWWRRSAVRRLAAAVPDPVRVLDVATGTADLAIALARAFPRARVTGVDCSEGMLALGREKVAAAGLADRIAFERADAMALPYADDSFDAVTCAFGTRNFSDPLLGLAQFARVLRPGGAALVMEFFRPRFRAVGAFVNGWIALGGAVAAPGFKGEFRHFQRSIDGMKSVKEFVDAAAGLGLESVGRHLYLPSCHALVFRKRPR